MKYELLNSFRLIITLLLFSFPVVSYAQTATLTGKVTDSENMPVIGANVIIEGTTTGTVTNIDGYYVLNVPAGDIKLRISFLGYLEETINTTISEGESQNFNLVLIEDLMQLEDIVVVGYGSMQKSNVSGAITSISSKEIGKIPVPNIVESLRGQVPGLRMTRTSGEPGSDVNVLIRGKNSLNSSNTPLIVIDGVPTTGGSISEINPNDVKSVNVLKDAAAASIYGTRGANGVILITTKKGYKGKPQINVRLSQGVTSLAHEPVLFNAQEYVQLKQDAAEGAGLASDLESVLTDQVELESYNTNRELDWHDIMLRNGTRTNANVSLSAGSDDITLYMNADILKEKGIALATDYNRYSYRLNTDYKPYEFLKLGTRVQLTSTQSDQTGGLTVPVAGNIPLFFTFVNNTPLGRLTDDGGRLVPTIRADQFAYNPMFKYRESQADRETSRVYLNPYLEITFLKNIKYTLNAFVEKRNNKYSLFRSAKYDWSTLDDDIGINESEIEEDVSTTYLVDHILNYDKVFASRHFISSTLIYGFQKFGSDVRTMSNTGTPIDLLGYYTFGMASTTESTLISTDDWRIQYFAARASYSFDEKYVVTGTIRRDGSSKFGVNNRFGYFPSVSFAWNVHKESFIPETQQINDIKFRASYGVLGNDQIPTFAYASLTNPVTYPFEDKESGGLVAGNLPNPDLKWEESRQVNFGLDFTFLEHRLFGNIDYYRINTVDLLLNQQVSAISGAIGDPPSILTNIGKTQSHGLEMALSYDVISRDLKWSVSANAAFDRNKIIRLNELDEDGNPINDETNGWFIGQDIDVIYDYDNIGIYKQGMDAIASRMHPTIYGYGPGDPRIRDVNGDGVITFDDRTFIGTQTPTWYGGITNTFSYKGFELSIIIETVQGVMRENGFYGNLTGRSNQIKVNYWTPTNQTGEFPQPNAVSGYYYSSAVNIRDASFISLRNVSLTYNLPGKFLEKLKIKSMQLSARGNNLKYFTDYKDAYSPETNFGDFPVTKVWEVGTSITF
jgi:TonB-linked SusC/RagA family outer membrane protein